MDDVIFEEFKGTGNMESTWTAPRDKRVFPAIDIQSAPAPAGRTAPAAGRVERIWVLRKVLSPLSTVEAMELVDQPAVQVEVQYGIF